MKNIYTRGSSYDGISDWYEQWCLGDENFIPSKQFYCSFLKQYEGPFLEVGIGTGRIAMSIIEQQKARVVGIDVSDNMLQICRLKYQKLVDSGKAQGTLELEHCDMTEIDWTDKFQVIYIPFRTIGHCMSDEDLHKVFSKCYAALQKTGLLVFDHYVFQKEWALQHDRVNIPMYHDGQTDIADYYEYNFEDCKMNCFIKVNGEVVQNFPFRWLDPEHIRCMTADAGFSVERLMGNFDGISFDGDSFNQIWILKK